MRRMSLRNQPLFNRLGGGGEGGENRRRIHERGGGLRGFQREQMGVSVVVERV